MLCSTAAALAVLVVLSGAATSATDPVVAVPERAVVGEDHDGDGVPRNVSIRSANYTWEGGVVRSAGAPIVVPLDHDDRDRETPGPWWHFGCNGGSDGPCFSYRHRGIELDARAFVFPGYECKTGRITLCYYWSPSLWLRVDNEGDGAAARTVALGPFTILP